MNIRKDLTVMSFALAAIGPAHASAGEPAERAEAAEDGSPTGSAPTDEPVDDGEDALSVAFLLDPLGHALSPASGVAIAKPEIQIALGDYSAIDLMPAFAYYFGGDDDMSAIGGGAHLGVRISPWGTGLEGFYTVPRFGVVYVEGSSSTESIHAAVASTTLELGYSWVFGNFVMNAGGGAGYAFTVEGYDVYASDPLGGLQLLANFSLGFGL